MSKKLTPVNVGKLGVKQSNLHHLLNKDLKVYLKCRRLKALGVKVRSPVSLTNLQQRQAEINKIRVQLGHPRIRAVQKLKAQLRRLKI